MYGSLETVINAVLAAVFSSGGRVGKSVHDCAGMAREGRQLMWEMHFGVKSSCSLLSFIRLSLQIVAGALPWCKGLYVTKVVSLRDEISPRCVSSIDLIGGSTAAPNTGLDGVSALSSNPMLEGIIVGVLDIACEAASAPIPATKVVSRLILDCFGTAGRATVGYFAPPG